MKRMFVLVFMMFMVQICFSQPSLPPAPSAGVGGTTGTSEMVYALQHCVMLVWSWDVDNASSFVITRLNASGLSDAAKAKWSQMILRGVSRPRWLWSNLSAMQRRAMVYAVVDTLGQEASRLEAKRNELLRWRTLLMDNVSSITAVNVRSE